MGCRGALHRPIRLISRPSKRPPPESAGDLAVVERNHAVYQYVFNPGGCAVRIFEGCYVVDLSRVENCYIGERASAQDASVAQTKSLCRKAGEFPNRLFQCKQVLLPNITAKDPRKSAISTRVYLGFTEWSLDVDGPCVRSHAHKLLAQGVLHVIFV